MITKSSIKSDVLGALASTPMPSIDLPCQAFNIAEAIRDAFDTNRTYPADLATAAEAWDVVAGDEFDDVAIEPLEFSRGRNAIQCVEAEAAEIVSAYWDTAIALVAEDIDEAVNRAVDSITLPDDQSWSSLQVNAAPSASEDGTAVGQNDDGEVLYTFKMGAITLRIDARRW